MAKLVEITASTDIPVHVKELADFLRLDDAKELKTVEDMAKAVTQRLQKIHWTQFLTATFDQYFDTFDDAPFVLDRPPVGTVSSVKYYDTSSVLQTLSADVWEQGDQNGLGVVRLAYNQTWPTCRGHTDDIVIRFTAGYGGVNDVPATIRHAIYKGVDLLYQGTPEDQVYEILETLMEGYSFRCYG